MTHIEEISSYITQYGYLAILLGTFLEGETIVIIAGYLAHQGLISWQMVVVCAVLGSCTSDQIMFSIGKFKGPWVMRRFAWLDRGAKKVLPFMRKHENLLAFGFRFVYGVRNVTPICLGAGGMPFLRFFILNVTGGIVWALSFVGAGYFFGEAIQKLLNDDKEYGLWGALILAGIIFMIWLAKKLLGRRRARKKTASRIDMAEPASTLESAAHSTGTTVPASSDDSVAAVNPPNPPGSPAGPDSTDSTDSADSPGSPGLTGSPDSPGSSGSLGPADSSGKAGQSAPGNVSKENHKPDGGSEN